MVLHAPAAAFTWDDLLSMPDDGYRRELVRGQLLVTPSPLGRHQYAAGELHFLLRSARPPGMEVLAAPFDWKRSESTASEPDLLVFRSEDYDPDGWLTVTPLLVVEIASPTTAVTDRTLERAVYEEAGVPSYWLVDPAEPSLTVLELDGAVYGEVATVRGDEPFEATSPFPVTVVASALVRRRRAGGDEVPRPAG